MAKGGGSAGLIFAVALLIAFASQCSSVEGGTYRVGGAQGWGFSSYSKWLSKAPRFKAGDIMNFKYTPNSHDVVAVGSNDFKSCRVTGRAKRYTSGNDNIALKKGWNYFICGFPGHCAGGMKVAIKAI